MKSRERSQSVAQGVQFTISQVARRLNVSPSTLRMWEQRGLARPQRSESGYRVYRLEDIERLKQIHQMREQNLNPDAIRQMLGAAKDGSGYENGPGSAEKALGSIGARLRRLRLARGMTLLEAAKKVELSPSFLSCVERGQANASVASLQKLSVIYESNVLGFFAQAETRSKLVRPQQRRRLSPEPGIDIELLAEGERAMSPHLFRIAPGASSGGSYHREGEEFVYVIVGSCDVWLDEVEHYRLEAGDSLYFSSRQTHRCSNAGDMDAVLLWINTPPAF